MQKVEGDRKMKKFSRLFLFGSLLLILLTAACGANQSGTPTLVGSTLPTLETSTPSVGVDTTMTAEAATASTEAPVTGLETATLSTTQNVSTQTTSVVGSPVAGTSQTPGIPVTGLDILLVECQFCIDNMAHALLVLPDTATFEVLSSTSTTTNPTGTTVKTNCSTIEVNNGKQVVLCSGLENTPITLNICTNGTTCTTFPVQLQACPLSQVNTAVPSTNNTQSPLDTPAAGTGSATPSPAVGAGTATPITVINTPTP
jgi:hypothetical protein